MMDSNVTEEETLMMVITSIKFKRRMTHTLIDGCAT